MVQFRRRNTELAVGKIQLWEHVAIIIWLYGSTAMGTSSYMAVWLYSCRQISFMAVGQYVGTCSYMAGETYVGTCSYKAGGLYSCRNM